MASDNRALAALADRFGISAEFWDWKGRHTRIADETLIAILSSLEIDASTPEAAEDALRALDAREWKRMLPPCIVAEAGHGVHVNVHVPAGAEGRGVHPAGGRPRVRRQVENWTPDREVDGQWLGEATFWLGSDLPLGYHRIVARTPHRSAESSLIITPNFVGFPARWGRVASGAMPRSCTASAPRTRGASVT